MARRSSSSSCTSPKPSSGGGYSATEDPKKHWKFSPADLTERARWDKYVEAYDEAIRATSTPWAPWYVIPADAKWVARALVADILTHTIESLDLEYPQLTRQQRRAMTKAREQLLAEKS